MKNVPNILSTLRFFLGLSLMALAAWPGLFVADFLLCGFTDLADGYIARKYNAQSELGAKLDSAADITFNVSAIVTLFFFMKLHIRLYYFVPIALVSVYKLVNVAITKRRFGEFNVLHTYANKVAGFFVYCCIPVFALAGQVLFSVVVSVCTFMGIAAVEETVILFTAETYNVNYKSLKDSKSNAS